MSLQSFKKARPRGDRDCGPLREQLRRRQWDVLEIGRERGARQDECEREHLYCGEAWSDHRFRAPVARGGRQAIGTTQVGCAKREGFASGRKGRALRRQPCRGRQWMLTTLARLQHTSSDQRAMLAVGKSAEREAECSSSAGGRYVDIVCDRAVTPWLYRGMLRRLQLKKSPEQLTPVHAWKSDSEALWGRDAWTLGEKRCWH
jgi:hypothetical protein